MRFSVIYANLRMRVTPTGCNLFVVVLRYVKTGILLEHWVVQCQDYFRIFVARMKFSAFPAES